LNDSGFATEAIAPPSMVADLEHVLTFAIDMMFFAA